MKKLFKTMLEKLRNNESLVLCSIIASSGSTPRGSGAKMAVFEDGSTLGTIGGGAVEYESIRLAKEALNERSAFIKGFDLSPNQTAGLGMVCGGSVVVYFQFLPGGDSAAAEIFGHILSLYEKDTDAWLVMQINEGCVSQTGVYERGGGLLFADMPYDIIKPMLKSRAVLKEGEPQYYAEPLTQAGTVYIFGGGHVSQELVPVIEHVGFKPVVYEDREEFAAPLLFPKAFDTIVAPFDEAEKHIRITDKDYVVIMTRGHQWDYAVIEKAIRTPAAYIGLIGSRHKIAATFKKLTEAGIPESEFSRISTPIGLPIKGETPAEIAISIAAEMILRRAELKEEKE